MSLQTLTIAAALTMLACALPAAAQDGLSDWRRLSLAEKSEVWITLDAAAPIRRIVLSADAATITVADRGLPGQDQRVETYPRARVLEVRLVNWTPPKKFSRYLFGLAGLVGFSAGTMARSGMCEQMMEGCSNRSYVIAGAVGAVGSSIAMRHHDRKMRDGVVYRRAP